VPAVTVTVTAKPSVGDSCDDAGHGPLEIVTLNRSGVQVDAVFKFLLPDVN
jgi:hypothetical protein